MKIKNDLISIKMGKKQYDFRNLILDEYLKIFASTQIDINENTKTSNRKDLTYLLIKFDTPLENLNESSVLVNEDFDVCASYHNTAIQEFSENSVITQYDYKINDVLEYANANYPETNNISKYYGKKVTAIGFNSFGAKSTSVSTNVKAVLDTSNYNIYIQENQDFTVTRKDIITTDALFYSNNKRKISGTIHLAPLYNEAVIEPTILKNEEGATITGPDISYGVIYSIGMSSYIDRIDKELVIGKDIEIIQNGAELSIEGIENYWSKEKLLYPNSNLYPNSGLYPIKSNYKYIIFKYKVWQNILSGTYENPVYTMTDTGYFYYQVVPISKFGELNLKIKYERG